MKSPRGFSAAVVLLLGLPTAMLYQAIFARDPEVVIHCALACGFFLISLGILDFKSVPRWMNWIACASAAALGFIFLLQAISDITHHPTLTHVAFAVLGQGPEKWLHDVFVLWSIAVLVWDSRGRTRILGVVATAVVVCLELYRYGRLFQGIPMSATAPALLLLYLLSFVWLLFESGKRRV
jgi:hypothetical protein